MTCFSKFEIQTLNLQLVLLNFSDKISLNKKNTQKICKKNLVFWRAPEEQINRQKMGVETNAQWSVSGSFSRKKRRDAAKSFQGLPVLFAMSENIQKSEGLFFRFVTSNLNCESVEFAFKLLSEFPSLAPNYPYLVFIPTNFNPWFKSEQFVVGFNFA